MMVHEEIERRQNLDQQAQRRKEQIQQEYQPLHRDLYRFEVNGRKIEENKRNQSYYHELFSHRSSAKNSKNCVLSRIEINNV